MDVLYYKECESKVGVVSFGACIFDVNLWPAMHPSMLYPRGKDGLILT